MYSTLCTFSYNSIRYLVYVVCVLFVLQYYECAYKERPRLALACLLLLYLYLFSYRLQHSWLLQRKYIFVYLVHYMFFLNFSMENSVSYLLDTSAARLTLSLGLSVVSECGNAVLHLNCEFNVNI